MNGASVVVIIRGVGGGGDDGGGGRTVFAEMFLGDVVDIMLDTVTDDAFIFEVNGASVVVIIRGVGGGGNDGGGGRKVFAEMFLGDVVDIMLDIVADDAFILCSVAI